MEYQMNSQDINFRILIMVHMDHDNELLEETKITIRYKIKREKMYCNLD
jgi:hypothetical protein